MTFGLSTLNTARDLYASRREPEAARMIALIAWRGMLVIAFLILVGSIAYGEWSLYSIFNGLGNVQQTPIPSPALKREALQTTLDAFQSRQVREEALKQHLAPIPDPSK